MSKGKGKINGLPVSPEQGNKARPQTIDQDMRKYLLERHAQLQADEAIRSDPDLRLAMVAILPQIGQVVSKAAAELAAQKGDASLFNADNWGDIMIWQLTEFLGCGLTEFTDTPANMLTRLCQVDQAHAADWFFVETLEDGSLSPLTIEKSELVIES